MNQVVSQWDVLITLYMFFSWCHGGITNIKCSGRLWVEPATVFRMGMNVSVYCYVALKNCQPSTLHFYTNDNKESFQMTRINKTTAWFWYPNFLEPHASLFCTGECPGYFQETLICGKDISAGYPPDVPDEITCVIHEYSSHMTCTWNTGKPTYLDTRYLVHVESLETGEEQQYLTSSYINISTDSLQGGKKYLVWVQAANVLGTEMSKPLQVDLDDIVIPSATIISKIEDLNTTMPRTEVHWSSRSTIKNISCEVRHRNTANETWNVKEFATNLTYMQRSEFHLESNNTYVFQVRCQETGRRYWQPWSPALYHKTLESVPQTALKSSQRETQNSGLLITSTFKEHLISDNRQDIGLLSGMVFFAVLMSIFSLIGIFNRSLRTGIKRRTLLLIPKWLHEDIPKMENSKVVKMLQEQNKFMSSNSSQQVLYADPVVTEIEVFLPEERKPIVYTKETSRDSLEPRDCLQKSAHTGTTVVYIPDLNTGYKPQISEFLMGGSHLGSHEEMTPPTFKPPDSSLDLGENASFQKYPHFVFSVSSMNSQSNTLFLGDLNLISNQAESNPSGIQDSGEGETALLLENASPTVMIPEQTLLPDDFVSCLGILNEDLPSMNSYFPQNVLENHFNRILLLEK
ncbi:interleukin-23 receptor [Erinaceus europaeus]|uniref:Interleukin-23 receptor n=1 Tax=Erinaceus europaeus TaxID=9365 RepID=A0A1S3ANS8_ERIEU|nr:interleukin-23 receptor [Erinaceus europaeus]